MHLRLAVGSLLLTVLSPALAKVLGQTSFGIDPLSISTFGGFGNGPPNVTTILGAPSSAHSGSSYLSINFPDPSTLPPLPPNEPRSQYVTFVQGLSLHSDSTYVARIWAKSPKADGKCFVAIGFHGNDGNLLNVTQGEVVKGKWAKYQISVESGEQVEDAKGGASYFYVTCTGGVAETVWLDDYELILK